MWTTELTDGVVKLRPFQWGDAGPLYAAIHESLAELKPWMSWAHDAYAIEEAESFVRITLAYWEERRVFAFAITDPQTGEIVGGCSLSHIHPIYRLCNIGYWVRTSRHGEGLAGRAALLAARYGFEHGSIIRGEIVMAVENDKSRRVAEKIGAHYEGVLRNRMVIGRRITDAHMYSLTPQDFGLEAKV